MTFSGNLDGTYTITVECPDKDYSMFWAGYADHPMDALSKAMTARQEDLKEDEDG